jgi:hypothetical protein
MFQHVGKFEIDVGIENGVVVIWANKDGLKTLANALLHLAQDDMPGGYHLHFDDHTTLDEGSNELVIGKKR